MGKRKNKDKPEKDQRDKYSFERSSDRQSHGLMKEIFMDGNRQLPDMTKLERKKTNWRKVILISLIFFLILAAGAALAGFYYFNKKSEFKESGVDLTYSGKTQAVSGEDLEIKIKMINKEAVSLSDQTLEIQYPEGFVYGSSNFAPSGQYKNQWVFKTLLSGQETELQITGQLVGEIGTAKKFKANWIYQPINFNSEFQKQIEWEVVITSSTLELELSGPREIIPGQEINYTLNYKNSSNRDLQRLKITADWPDGFTLSTASPEADVQAGWSINSLPAGDTGKINLAGRFEGQPGDSKEFIFKIGLIQSNGSFNIQLEENFIILLIEPQLQINLFLNDETTDQSVRWGETLVYNIEIENAGDVKLDEAEMTLQLNGYSNQIIETADYVDWETLIVQNADRADNRLTWKSGDNSQLETIKPGDSLSLRAEVSLLSSPPSDILGKTNYALTAQVAFRADRVDSNSQTTLVYEKTSSAVNGLIQSQAFFTSEARYYDASGQVVGLGPLPPVEGEATLFKIFWTLENGSNDLSQATVSTVLPETVSWIGQGSVTAGQPLAYNQSTREIIWSLNKIPAQTGNLTEALKAEFSVSLTPIRSQLNEYVLLTDKSIFQATDNFTKATVQLTKEAQSTSLSNDEYARGLGKVIGRGE